MSWSWMAFLILVGLWNQDKPWLSATNVALLSGASVLFPLNVPIFGKLLLWKGSQPIVKTQNCQVGPSPKSQVPLLSPKPTSLFIKAHPSVSELRILKYKAAWKGRKSQREARDPEAKRQHLILPAELSWWLPTLPWPASLPDREANWLFQFPRVESY